jgi:hypothetical protein
MGREKEYRQRLKYQVNSVLKKSIETQLSTEFMDTLGMSETESRLLAARCKGWLSTQIKERLPNQIIIPSSAGRANFHHCRGRYEKKDIVITPFDFEDLEVELEFGLKAMQNNRLIRIIEEAQAQDSLITQKQLTALCQITPTSIRHRLQLLRKKGIRVPVPGLRVKDRNSMGLTRATYAIREYLKGSATYKVREECFLSKGSFSRICTEMARVAQGFDKLDPSEICQRLGISEFQVKEYSGLLAGVSQSALKKLTDRFNFEEHGDQVLREDCAEKFFQSQIKTEFGCSPIKLRAIGELLEEFCYRVKIEREDTEIIYWAVSCNEPAGKPLTACKLVPVRLKLLDATDYPDLKDDRHFNRVSKIKFSKIVRYTTQAKYQGGYLTQADLSYLLGIHTVAVQRLIDDNQVVVIPLRGRECDIGRGITHRRKIIELYLQMHTETEIVSRTGHSYEAIEGYLKEFAAVCALRDQGMPLPLIRKVLKRSSKLVKAYLELLSEYDTPDYAFRLAQLRQIFYRQENEFPLKKTG